MILKPLSEELVYAVCLDDVLIGQDKRRYRVTARSYLLDGVWFRTVDCATGMPRYLTHARRFVAVEREREALESERRPLPAYFAEWEEKQSLITT